MKVSCPSCEAKYNIADDKVKGKKVKVRCKTCGSQILVDGTTLQVASGAGDAQTEELRAENATTNSSAPTSADVWTVNFSDADERMLTTAEIVDMAVHGRLGSEVFIWKDGMGDWSLIANVPELASAIAAAKKKSSAGSKPPAANSGAVGAAGTRSAAPPPAVGANEAKKAAESSKGAVGKQASTSHPPAADQPALRAGPIVAAPGSALAKKLASAKNAAAAQKELTKENAANAVAARKKASSESEQPPAPKAATKLATKRQAGAHDLFAAVDKAGSEIDVDTSEVEEHDTAAKTGARNENSVLFSLDALKSGLGGGAAAAASKQAGPAGSRKKGPAAPSKRLEDLMTVDMPGPAFGGSNAMSGGGLLLSGNDALLAAPPPPPPKPDPKPDFAMQAALGVDIAAHAPPKQRLGLIIGLAAALVALGAGGAVFALKSGAIGSKPASSVAVPSATAMSAIAVASAAPSAASAASASASNVLADAAAPAATALTASAAAAGAKVGGRVASSKNAGDTKATDKKPETKAAEPAPAVAAGSFNTDAAKAQLSMMASQSTVCKRPEGPWGTGRAVITFASSGRVTTANVTGDPFGGTAVGGCVANVFRRAKVPPFSGDSVTVSKSFTIAP